MLYGFDFLKDLVYDAMHNLPLNVVSKHVHRLLENKEFDNKELDLRLGAVPWPSGSYLVVTVCANVFTFTVNISSAEMKDGHIPAKFSTRLGYWTAEDFRRFSMVAEVVLRGMVPDTEYHIWYLLARMTELVYNTGRDGWNMSNICLFNKLARRYNIFVEESFGVQSCVVTGHNLEHLHEDMKRFSSPDNFWCHVFERVVKRYVQRSSNKKGIEVTFAKAEERRELAKFIQTKNSCEFSRENGSTITSSLEVRWNMFCSHMAHVYSCKIRN